MRHNGRSETYALPLGLDLAFPNLAREEFPARLHPSNLSRGQRCQLRARSIDLTEELRTGVPVLGVRADEVREVEATCACRRAESRIRTLMASSQRSIPAIFSSQPASVAAGALEQVHSELRASVERFERGLYRLESTCVPSFFDCARKTAAAPRPSRLPEPRVRVARSSQRKTLRRICMPNHRNGNAPHLSTVDHAIG